ncbi:MAG: hypothetical protein J6J21_02595, partial [Clostridia bacterium]|nr:hypothetical protein [Clostridia bacterium]
MKRILSLVLALFMALGCASMVAVSAETLVETDFTLELESLEFTEEDNPADGDTITLEVYMQNLTDEDDLGSIQVNVNYDDTKLEFLAAREKTGTGKKAVTHMAGYFGLFQSAAPATNPAKNFVVTTEMENPCWDSEWDINNDIFFVLDFKVLGDWAETEITLDGEAMPRRDASEGYYFSQDGVTRQLTWGSATITRPYEAEITPAENANFTKAYNYYRDFAPMAAEYFSETFWGGFTAFINKGLEFVAAGDQEALDAHSDAGVNGNWFINRMHFKSTAGINATTGGSAATVNGTDYVIPAATPVLMNYDRLYVSHADYDGVDVA